MQLDSHESVHEMLEDFDLKPGEIADFFRSHGTEPAGIIHYGVIMARAALSDGFGDEPAKSLVALFCGGVALGMQLADQANDDLSIDELAWLLGLAKGKRKKRERDAPRIQQKPGQSDEDYRRARQSNQSALEWATGVEDHLIRLVGDRDPEQLRDEHRARYETLRAAAA